MTELLMKRVYEPASPDDGFRVLADRLWPRGISKDGAGIGLWAKDVTPSTGLRQAYHGGLISWEQFAQRYRAELLDGPALDEFAAAISDKPRVTLLFAGKDTEHTHVRVLMDAVRQKL